MIIPFVAPAEHNVQENEDKTTQWSGYVTFAEGSAVKVM